MNAHPTVDCEIDSPFSQDPSPATFSIDTMAVARGRRQWTMLVVLILGLNCFLLVQNAFVREASIEKQQEAVQAESVPKRKKQQHGRPTLEENTGVEHPAASSAKRVNPYTIASGKPLVLFEWDGISNDAEEPAKSEESSKEQGSSNEEEEEEESAADSNEINDKSSSNRPLPLIVWLASYPNSGTSYTMTMVERSTDLSTATNYGIEIASAEKDDSEPVHPDVVLPFAFEKEDGSRTDKINLPAGPFWDGLEGKNGNTIRQLPTTYVLTKTHCGGRCIRCTSEEYVVGVPEFLQACQRTSAYHNLPGDDGEMEHFRYEGFIAANRVAGVLHLIRNPFTNIVSRYHLDRRHMLTADPSLAERYTDDSVGLARWCAEVDALEEKARKSALDPILPLDGVKCRAEFYKYAQWHNRVQQMLPHLGTEEDGEPQPLRLLIVYYEDYEKNLNRTVDRIMNFLEQETVHPLRPFRTLPTYNEHFSEEDREAAKRLIKAVVTPRVYKLLKRYLA